MSHNLYSVIEMNDGDSKGLTLSFQKIWTKGGYKKKFKGYFVIKKMNIWDFYRVWPSPNVRDVG